ncbi:MAG: saccharopine dehydrogenase NADP-binding domain-containing protein [Rhodanobacteraceae bacterium]|nr:saccharopine dehydrogenase NADP-binding domain-containing protein [Rhodanobacteraceae bacterium]
MGGWMLYGANGYTAKLILDLALQAGQRPVLAGRNRDAINALAKQHDLPARIFDLEHPDTLASALSGIDAVLHCAGPFSATAAPMLDGCLQVGAHYLDITGEISVFKHCHEQHDRAKAAGIVVIPGTGFDVVPTDSLAAILKRELPEAHELVLAFDAGGGPSQGTAKTAVEGLASGGKVRRNGELLSVPLAYKTREFEFDGARRFAMTIPWGDVYTAYISTGIPNIEVYMGVSPKTAERVRRLNWVRPLLGLGFVQRWLKSQTEKRGPGPSDDHRGRTGATVWGEVRSAGGREVCKVLTTPNGYDLTAHSALAIMNRILATPPAGGFYTASQLMGPEFVPTLPGVQLHG